MLSNSPYFARPKWRRKTNPPSVPETPPARPKLSPEEVAFLDMMYDPYEGQEEEEEFSPRFLDACFMRGGYPTPTKKPRRRPGPKVLPLNPLPREFEAWVKRFGFDRQEIHPECAYLFKKPDEEELLREARALLDSSRKSMSTLDQARSPQAEAVQNSEPGPSQPKGGQGREDIAGDEEGPGPSRLPQAKGGEDSKSFNGEYREPSKKHKRLDDDDEDSDDERPAKRMKSSRWEDVCTAEAYIASLTPPAPPRISSMLEDINSALGDCLPPSALQWYERAPPGRPPFGIAVKMDYGFDEYTKATDEEIERDLGGTNLEEKPGSEGSPGLSNNPGTSTEVSRLSTNGSELDTVTRSRETVEAKGSPVKISTVPSSPQGVRPKQTPRKCKALPKRWR